MSEVIRYASFKEEQEYNEAPDTSSVDFNIDIASATLDTPTDTEIEVPTGLGRSINRTRPGFYSPSGNVVYPFDVNTIIKLLKWTLGESRETTMEHLENEVLTEIWVTNNKILPSFLTAIGKDLFEHIFTGCVMESLELQVEDGVAQATANINAAKDHIGNIKNITSEDLPVEYPIAFHEVFVAKGFNEINADVNTLTVNFENGTDPDAGRGMGSRHPFRIIANTSTITISCDLKFKNLEHLNDFYGSEYGPSPEGSNDFPLIIGLCGGEYGFLDLYFPSVKFTAVPIQPSGQDEIIQSVSMRAFPKGVMLHDNTPVVTPILVSARSIKSGGEE